MNKLNNILRRYWWIVLLILAGIESELPDNISILLSIFVMNAIAISGRMKEHEEMTSLGIAPVEGNPAYHEAKVRQCRANLDKYTYKNAVVVSLIVTFFLSLLNIGQFIFSLDTEYLGLPVILLAIMSVTSICGVSISRTTNKKELEYHKQKLMKLNEE